MGAISQEGDYQIEWPDFLTYPLGQATFKANVTPFNATNSNCTTCDEFTQVVTEDDDIGTISEGASESVAVLDNDAICCYPVTLTIVSINSDLVQSASRQWYEYRYRDEDAANQPGQCGTAYLPGGLR